MVEPLLLILTSMMASLVELFGQFVLIAVIARLLLWSLPSIFRYLRPRPNIWRPSPTNWAVITGGTDGIGLAYCKQLATMGYPLLIISRNQEKLESIKTEIMESCPACPEVKILSFDFSINKDSHYDKIESVIRELPNVDVLVNNVGISFKNADYFTVILAKNPQLLPAMINVNVVSAVKMTKMVWDRMMANNRGIILNIGSMSALSPVPLLAIYSATKAFVDYFSKGLSLEAQSRPGIIIQSILPGFVSTKMSQLRPSMQVPTADQYVSSALERVGRSRRTYGYWWHSLEGIVYEVLQYVLGANFNSWLAFHQLSKLRSRYYRIKKMEDIFYSGNHNLQHANNDNTDNKKID